MNILISLYDLTGNWSRPYAENGWQIFTIDIQTGTDILTWDYKNILLSDVDKIGILIAQPCTCYALCGNKHKVARLASGEFAQSQKLVAKTKEIIDYFDDNYILDFWALENPKTDIHKKKYMDR